MGKSGIGAVAVGVAMIILAILMLGGWFDWIFNVIGVLLLIVGGVTVIHGIYNMVKGGGGGDS